MPAQSQLHEFLRQAHIFAAAVREILEEKCLRQSTDVELSFHQFTLLQLISNNGDHQVVDIANFFGVSPAAASKSVDKLVRLGLLNRQAKETDRRAVSLSLTPTGKGLIRRYESVKAEKLERALGHLESGELHQVSRDLEKTSYALLEKEAEFRDICLRCSALYAPECVLRELHHGCLYDRRRSLRGG